jgi:hypothetical protein
LVFLGGLDSGRDLDLSDFEAKVEMDMRDLWPNKSPEATAVGACSSAIAVRVASRRWLSFFR